MPIIFAIFVFLTLILLANKIFQTENKTYFRLFDWLMVAMNLLITMFGFILMLIPADQLNEVQVSPGIPLENPLQVGITIALTGAWGTAVSLLPIRRFMARWLPLNPDSPVHALALVLSGYLAGNTFVTLTQGGLEELATTVQPTGLLEIVFQFLMFAFLALFGVGFPGRRQGVALIKRLGLERPTRAQLVTGVRWMLILVLFQWAVGAISLLIDPDPIELVDEINISLLGNIDTPWEWLILALSTGVGEELLFRGALQPVLGLEFTAVLFAIAHVQYGITPVTLTVLIIGIIFGHLRRRTNTSVVIFVHSGYNFILGIMTLAAASLTQ